MGLQDKGLQYQGDSLTPKYPAGLNWRRPITVMGAHTGPGLLGVASHEIEGEWNHDSYMESNQAV